MPQADASMIKKTCFYYTFNNITIFYDTTIPSNILSCNVLERFDHSSTLNAPFYDLIDDSGIPRRDLSFPDVKTHLGATYKLKNSLKIICSIIFILNQHAPNQPVKSYTPLMYMYIDMRIHIYIYIYIYI